jgi:hypothetical protein
VYGASLQMLSSAAFSFPSLIVAALLFQGICCYNLLFWPVDVIDWNSNQAISGISIHCIVFHGNKNKLQYVNFFTSCLRLECMTKTVCREVLKILSKQKVLREESGIRCSSSRDDVALLLIVKSPALHVFLQPVECTTDSTCLRNPGSHLGVPMPFS